MGSVHAGQDRFASVGILLFLPVQYPYALYCVGPLASSRFGGPYPSRRVGRPL